MRFFRHEEWGALQTFIRAHTHDRYILADKRYFDWQFTPQVTDAADTAAPSVLVLEINGTIRGYLGIITLPMNYYNTDVRGACLANLMTDTALRNRGVGVDFIARAQDAGYDLVYTTGYLPPLTPIYRHLGWQTDLLLRRFLFIIDANKTSTLAGVPVSESCHEKKAVCRTYICEEQFAIPDGIDALWMRVKEKYPITVIRSRAYLTWRYAHNPFLKYRFVTVRTGGVIEAYAVVRIEHAGDYTIGRIIDFIATDASERSLLAAVTNLCKRSGAHLIDFFFTGNFHEQSLLDAGFVEDTYEPYARIPIRFQPLDRTIMHINCAFRIMSPHPQVGMRMNSNDWYITKGDGDQDRGNPR